MANQNIGRVRAIIYRALLIAVMPFLVFGLIDPLEGGISMLFAAAIYLIAFLIGGTKPARYLWVPFLVAMVIGSIVLAYALVIYSGDSEPSSFPAAIIVGNGFYTAAVFITLISGVVTAVQAFRKRN